MVSFLLNKFTKHNKTFYLVWLFGILLVSLLHGISDHTATYRRSIHQNRYYSCAHATVAGLGKDDSKSHYSWRKRTFMENVQEDLTEALNQNNKPDLLALYSFIFGVDQFIFLFDLWYGTGDKTLIQKRLVFPCANTTQQLPRFKFLMTFRI